ncbi:DUF3270 domain-containing protein [Streptococcus sp. H49]|uniref:DUF3270 domain-containing protein n=1 Tax=Streptococcus huangxiaojuni TaxID=3237239 RepID=UPI0034A1F452
MAAPLKKTEQFEQEKLQETPSPKFQEFQEINSNNAKLRELMFFTRVAVFAVTTVLAAFTLLALNLSPIWSFVFALLISAATTSTLSVFIMSLKK